MINTVIAGCEVDCAWPAAGLVVEVDGWAHHRDRSAFERDRERDLRLQLAGQRVVRITHRRLAADPDRLEREILTLLGKAG